MTGAGNNGAIDFAELAAAKNAREQLIAAALSEAMQGPSEIRALQTFALGITTEQTPAGQQRITLMVALVTGERIDMQLSDDTQRQLLRGITQALAIPEPELGG